MPALTLGAQQRRFAFLVGKFLVWIYDNGYAVSFGETYRTPQQAQWNADHGLGIANSLHTLRLAIDLNLFQGAVLLNAVDDYRPLGTQWKTLDADARWGGDFSKPDAYHFSLTWNGVQ